MTRQNRIDPWGDMHPDPARGTLTGNRGCLVDGGGNVVRHHRGSLWISCLTEYRGWRSPLAAPNRWTPLFFLDDAVALAAGHRPCGLCRRDTYRSYRDAVTSEVGGSRPFTAGELDRRLATERLRTGRGVSRAGDRKLWSAPASSLPDGTVVLVGAQPHLVDGDQLHRFSFGGWEPGRARSGVGAVDVLTPPTSVAALRGGFRPLVHPSAAR